MTAAARKPQSARDRLNRLALIQDAVLLRLANPKTPEGPETTLREHASAMATRRWKNTSEADKKKVGKALAKARKAKVSPERRSEIARNAALARHGKAADPK